MPDTEDFYEDDEPVEDVVTAWNSGVVGTTAPPSHLLVMSIQNVTTGLAFSGTNGIGKLVTEGSLNRGTLVAG
jgi:hypothetical protein